MIFRTQAVAGVWYSLAAALIPPDDSADWLDLCRHQDEAVIIVGRFKDVAAAVAWAWQHHGVEPARWREAGEAE